MVLNTTDCVAPASMPLGCFLCSSVAGQLTSEHCSGMRSSEDERIDLDGTDDSIPIRWGPIFDKFDKWLQQPLRFVLCS